LKQLANSSHF